MGASLLALAKSIYYMISYSAAAATCRSGLGAGLSRRRWSRCRFDSRWGHFRFHWTFFFCLFFCFFFVHIFSLWLVSLYSHCCPFTASREFCDNIFLVRVVTVVLARYLDVLPRTCFENLCQEASAPNSQFLPGVKLP